MLSGIGGVVNAAAVTRALEGYRPDVAEGFGVRSSEYPVGDVRRYGAVGDGDALRASNNSAAMQAGIDALYAMGGGELRVPRGTFCTNAPLLVPAGVSIRGETRNVSIIKKVTATPSAVSEALTVPVYQYPTAVGYPKCVIHCLSLDGAGIGWSDGAIQNLTLLGSSADPNANLVDYGLFVRGMAEGVVQNNYAAGFKVGFFWGAASTIMSRIAGNVTGRCHRGFYQYFMTGTTYHNNYAVSSRYCGHDLSAYYSHIAGNGCDSGGSVASGRLSALELFRAYVLYSCNGAVFEGNGAETNNGVLLFLHGCVSTAARNNLFIEITSDHDVDGGNDPAYALHLKNNTDITLEDNRFAFAPVKLSGAAVAGAASHYNWRVEGQVGTHVFNRNRFVDSIGGIAGNGWANTFGAFV